ncbi:hypothetical protein N7478_009744 [Penicillium angulare]|uniref:uncharacterized protein n=1 Tax=Penicillium angulare TaxID=116970 RepID=UPI0025424880|nr:uncharacterized protein N7478_009744 [Penicillium angulare]KAJ5266936.1 hypothetical protein N7478_009744 [Penicillium angulare]
MDIFTNHRSYFSQHVVQLASQSQLFRYSACAVAAKQLGQMKDSTKATNNTPQSKITASKLLEVEPNIHFTWYGAKYYEKAILLMAQQISQTPNSTSHLSPSDIYHSTKNDDKDNEDTLGENGYASSLLRALSACVLCVYEDLNATMRAWSGHLDGVIKLTGPLIFLPVTYPDTCGVPQASRALETAFWYSALDDILNSLVLRKQCRLRPDDAIFWQRMNLPINNVGDLILDNIDEQDQVPIFLKALIRILGQIINHDNGSLINWTHLDRELTQWLQALSTEFLSPITHEFSDPVPEIWFGSDTCAITMAFYHMAKIMLLVNQPRDLFLAAQQDESTDLLSSYNSLQRDLNQHAREIIAIANGMPGIPVQKYMIHPLYLAGRCLSDSKDRERVIRLLKSIEDNVGVFTGYRIRDLSEEWGVPVEKADPPVYSLSHQDL